MEENTERRRLDAEMEKLGKLITWVPAALAVIGYCIAKLPLWSGGDEIFVAALVWHVALFSIIYLHGKATKLGVESATSTEAAVRYMDKHLSVSHPGLLTMLMCVHGSALGLLLLASYAVFK